MRERRRWISWFVLLASQFCFTYRAFGENEWSETEVENEFSQKTCDSKIGTMIWMKGACRLLPVARYAPLVYLAEGEKFEPSSVAFFLPFVEEKNGHLVTKEPLSCPTCKNLPFLYGTGPTAPVYAIVTQKSEEIIDLTYWFFYPYNLGKKVCIGFRVGDVCVGCKKEFGDHIADWEHIIVRTKNLEPTQVYLSWHGSGSTFAYGDTTSIAYEGTHPIVYSAYGSHGTYPKPGAYMYRKLPNGDNLTDIAGKGKAWRSWDNLDMILFKPGKVYEGKDKWMNYTGRWGNPKQGCGIYERVSGQCQLSDGPGGPIGKGAMTNPELE